MLARLPRPLRRFLRKIGSCPKCMRTSFVAAATSWLATGLLCTVIHSMQADGAAVGLSCLLSLLWVAHLVRYACRVNARTKACVVRGFSDKPGMALRAQPWSRRRALRSFAAAFVLMAAITSLPDRVIAQTNIGVRKCVACCDDDKDACLRQKRPTAECDQLSVNCSTNCQDPQMMAAYMATKRKLRARASAPTEARYNSPASPARYRSDRQIG